MEKCPICEGLKDAIAVKREQIIGLESEVAAANERANTYLGEMVRLQEREREFERAREAWKHVVVAHLMDTNDDEIEAEQILDAYFNPAKEAGE